MKRAFSYLASLVLIAPLLILNVETARAADLMLWEKMAYQMTTKEFLKAHKDELQNEKFADGRDHNKIILNARVDASGVSVWPIAHFKEGKLVSVQLQGNQNYLSASQIAKSASTYLKYMTDKYGADFKQENSKTMKGNAVVTRKWQADGIEVVYELEIDARTRTPIFDAWYYPVGKTRFY